MESKRDYDRSRPNGVYKAIIKGLGFGARYFLKIFLDLEGKRRSERIRESKAADPAGDGSARRSNRQRHLKRI